nr:glycosyltransferase family 4 protein [uncultured Mogibacterium sp.]
MKILLINHYAGSPEMGMEFRPYYLSREWIKQGHEVTIIAGGYSHLRKSNPSVSKNLEERMIDGIRYVWIKTASYNRNGLARAFSMFEFSRKLFSNAEYISERYQPDAVIASSTYPLDTYGADKIAKLSGAKYIHEVHDMWPSTLYELGGMSKSNPFVKLMQRAEDFAYRHCDQVVSLLDHSKEYMVQHGLAEEKFNCITNGVIKEEWENPAPIPEEHSQILNKMKDEGKFIVGYFGGHSISNNLDMLLSVAKKITDKNVCFVLVGDGSYKDRLMQSAKEQDLDNVVFLPAIDKSAIPNLITYFDIVTIFAANTKLYRFGICMNKMFDAMMGGKPLLMSVTTPETIVEKANAGIVTKAGDIDGYIEAVEKLKIMPADKLSNMGRLGHELVSSECTYDILATKFARIMEKTGKRILLINHYAGSPEMGMEFRPYYISRELVKKGHEVTIIAGSFSHLRKTNPDITENFTEQEIDGIKYVWIKTDEYDSNGVARAFSMYHFCKALKANKKKIVERYKPDVVISSSTYPLDSYPAYRIAKLAGAKYIHEVHDMWPLTLYEAGGMSKKNPFVIAMQFAEDHAYKKSDIVVSLLPHAKEYMVEHGMKADHFRYIPNGVVINEWDATREIPDEHSTAFKKLKAEGKFVIGYFGSHELSYGLHNLLDVTKQLSNENVHLVMVGKGKLKDELISYAEQNGINNVTFLPPVEKGIIPAVIDNFDAIFIGTIESPLYRFGICMNKMFDSMMAAKPIVMAITTPSTPVSESGCGIITKSCDNDAIKAAIRKIQSMSDEERKQMGMLGRDAVLSKYTYENIASEFEKVFE